MTSISTIRTAAKSRLTAHYAGTDVQVYDHVPGAPESPAVVVGVIGGSWHETMGADGLTMYQLAAIVIVSLGEREASEAKLNEMLSPSGTLSVRAAFEGDRTLGGVVKHCDPQSFRDVGTADWGGNPFLQATIDVQCLSS